MGFGNPSFFFYLFQLKAPGDKAISLASQGEWESQGTVLGTTFQGWQHPELPQSPQTPPSNGMGDGWVAQYGLGGVCPHEGGRRRQCPFSCVDQVSWLVFTLGRGMLGGGDIPLPNFPPCSSGCRLCRWLLCSSFAPLMMSPVSAASGKAPVWAAVPPTALGWPQAPLGTAFPVLAVPVQGCSAILTSFSELLSQK